ncbi:MAG: hypothetical protein GY920_09335 [Aliivibrio sp.]|nr:hypothetical protein [Aliivibrio sp.]
MFNPTIYSIIKNAKETEKLVSLSSANTMTETEKPKIKLQSQVNEVTQLEKKKKH